MHDNAHTLAGKTVELKLKGNHHQIHPNTDRIEIEDWQDRITGKPWRTSDVEGNPAAIVYGLYIEHAGLPDDDEVVYGKIGLQGFIIHDSELGDIIDE
jgi:hypothetical protein